jgi:hypothetical protein
VETTCSLAITPVKLFHGLEAQSQKDKNATQPKFLVYMQMMLALF